MKLYNLFCLMLAVCECLSAVLWEVAQESHYFFFLAISSTLSQKYSSWGLPEAKIARSKYDKPAEGNTHCNADAAGRWHVADGDVLQMKHVVQQHPRPCESKSFLWLVCSFASPLISL